jgi:hypothetical protein
MINILESQYGDKISAFRWQSSPTAGDAQCTFDCVAVTAANGTTFYPLVSSVELYCLDRF